MLVESRHTKVIRIDAGPASMGHAHGATACDGIRLFEAVDLDRVPAQRQGVVVALPVNCSSCRIRLR
jgi:hypothetical protein